jgi:hypothetical protein
MILGLQVSLLNQERIIEMIKDAIEEKLMNSNTTRIFQTQVIHCLCLHKSIHTWTIILCYVYVWLLL